MNKLLIYTDGGARGNPGPAAASAVVKDSAGNVRLLCGKYLGVATNNFAEYQGVIVAYENILKEKNLDSKDFELDFNLDSKLAVNQLNGVYKVKNANIRSLVLKIHSFETKFRRVSYRHIPRSQNTQADKIVNETLDEHAKK